MNTTIRKVALGVVAIALIAAFLIPSLSAHAARATYTFTEDNSATYTAKGIVVNPSNYKITTVPNFGMSQGYGTSTGHSVSQGFGSSINGNVSMGGNSISYGGTGSNFAGSGSSVSYGGSGGENWTSNSSTNGTSVAVQDEMSNGAGKSFGANCGGYGWNGYVNRRYVIGSTNTINFKNVNIYVEVNGDQQNNIPRIVNVDVNGASYCRIRLCDANKKPITTLETSTTKSVEYVLSPKTKYYLQIANLSGNLASIDVGYVDTMTYSGKYNGGGNIFKDYSNTTKSRSLSIQNRRDVFPSILEPVNKYKTSNWYSFTSTSGSTTLYYAGDLESGNAIIKVYDPNGKCVKTITTPANQNLSVKSVVINTSSGMGRTWYIEVTPATSLTNGYMGVSVK